MEIFYNVGNVSLLPTITSYFCNITEGLKNVIINDKGNINIQMKEVTQCDLFAYTVYSDVGNL